MIDYVDLSTDFLYFSRFFKKLPTEEAVGREFDY